MSLTPGRFAGQVRDARSTTSQRGMPSTTVAGVGGTGFSPLHLPRLALWLDAADTSTITASSGSVSQWNDKSGWGRNFTQATATNQPTTGVVSQNGLNCVDFDGSNDHMTAGDTLDTLTNDLTVFVCVAYTNQRTASGGAIAIAKWGQGWVVLYEVTGLTPARRLQVVYAGSASHGATSVGEFTNTSMIVQEMVLNRVGGVVSQTTNGVADGSGTFTPDISTNRDTANVLVIGNFSSLLSTYYLDGPIAEVVVCQAALSDSERRRCRNYLNAKWAVY